MTMRIERNEIIGSPAKLASLAKEHGIPYKPGDKLFRWEDGTIHAYRT